jgi:hypothetical protein
MYKKHLASTVSRCLHYILLGFFLALHTTKPVYALTYTVTSPADSGPGSLREALTHATSGDVITFDPAVFPSNIPTMIVLRSSLPPLDQGAVTIDASEVGVILQGAPSPDTSLDNALVIISDGNVIQGLQIRDFPGTGIWIGEGSSENVIGGRNPTPGVACTGACNLISNNEGDGINIQGSDHNMVIGNFIGTDAAGAAAMGNATGIVIAAGAQHNRIGGASPEEGNLVSGNTWDGVMIDGQNTAHNLVQGNTIGANAPGTDAIPNGNMGVNLGSGAQYNQIGGHTAGERNLISGNTNIGVHLAGEGVMHNVVIGNFIGTDVTGMTALGNGVHGVAFGGGAQHNRVGGEAPEAGNLISGNGDGVRLDSLKTSYNTVVGNLIGTDATGQGALGNPGYGVYIAYGPGPNVIGPGNTIAHNGLAGVSVQESNTRGNTITSNAIYNNGGAGIEQVHGGNAELPAPNISTLGSRLIRGTTSPGATVEVFYGAEGEGCSYEGSTVADEAGSFTFTIPQSRFTSARILLTATDTDGNTSPFSAPKSPPTPRLTWELPGIIAPTQISFKPAVVGTNLGLALFSVLFFGFTSNVFNAILEDYRDEVMYAFKRFVPRPLAGTLGKMEAALGRAQMIWLWLGVLALTSLIESFLDGEIALFSRARLGLLLTLFLSAVLVSALEWGIDLYLHRRWLPRLHIESKVQWIGLGLAVICVIVSRALQFQPGYLYGVVGAFYLQPDITGRAKTGKRALLVLLTVFLGGLSCWIATAFLPTLLLELEPIFLTVFLLSLQGVFFQLFPLTLTEGGDLWLWKKSLWLIFFSIVAFCFYHFVLNPNAAEVQALQQNGVQTLWILIGSFGLATFALWLLFPVRLSRRERTLH